MGSGILRCLGVNSGQCGREKRLIQLYSPPVLFSGHWWMYVLDKVKKSFFVIDSRLKEDPGLERTKINKFAGNLINQLLVRAGYQSLLTKVTKTKPEQRSWLPKYIKIHEQPNP
ncbi:hypothetical protein PIB30_090789 [Stylosanthes scabra]|uniref:Ubiquitin-like protease family profile domain-containing protein n=1 Tax=Stylosanthes scabra TaxID=79078 RepID=A0ABU6YW82_9FABA|nr:hypothetical protein [Stylosanthes scabra]